VCNAQASSGGTDLIHKTMIINRFSKILTAVFIAILFILPACKKEKIDEQENLNVLKVKIGASTFTWSDTDGAGGILPKIDTIRLTPNSSFTSEITVQDGSTTPPLEYNVEIISKNIEHLFVYKPIGNLAVMNLSKDDNGKDFGLTATVKTTASGIGSLQIILKHLPDKSAADPSVTGETDLEVVFPVVIK
jgi:hypothetical protein